MAIEVGVWGNFRVPEALDDMVRLLRAGKDVVSCSVVPESTPASPMTFCRSHCRESPETSARSGSPRCSTTRPTPTTGPAYEILGFGMPPEFADRIRRRQADIRRRPRDTHARRYRARLATTRRRHRSAGLGLWRCLRPWRLSGRDRGIAEHPLRMRFPRRSPARLVRCPLAGTHRLRLVGDMDGCQQ
jgi:hypothetical protein